MASSYSVCVLGSTYKDLKHVVTAELIRVVTQLGSTYKDLKQVVRLNTSSPNPG